jgi:hypothetical protein
LRLQNHKEDGAISFTGAIVPKRKSPNMLADRQSKRAPIRDCRNDIAIDRDVASFIVVDHEFRGCAVASEHPRSRALAQAACDERDDALVQPWQASHRQA